MLIKNKWKTLRWMPQAKIKTLFNLLCLCLMSVVNISAQDLLFNAINVKNCSTGWWICFSAWFLMCLGCTKENLGHQENVKLKAGQAYSTWVSSILKSYWRAHPAKYTVLVWLATLLIRSNIRSHVGTSRW